ncbi:MAG: biosynthetic-type acetolactate synthase large subunit [Dethiobacteria bacterium]|nr:biosynthetic-type acetolactate synthase large subunit [Bacillota bacterium]HOB29456.1 biosynthetic-type acetolactate synthase large subunit [Bacillota bacterium]HPZ42046.1 biosynthetic-type acetolactate synthase large subunit [Bacillota bacterium]HQD52979.1 biosynthetic-type acetolactate synthase large subunit [Bacillota bacterium]
MKQSGAQILIKCLEEEKVRAIFGYPGGAVLDIYDALYDSSLKHFLVRHEQGAAHAADGYARATGKPGVCLATSGPGATNLVTGLANAYMDSIPMVAFTGQVATHMIGRDSFQEADIYGITLPITKHNFLVKDVKELPRVVKESFHLATTGRPGPVLIDLPKDVCQEKTDLKYPKVSQLRGYRPVLDGHPEKISEAAAAITGARRPVICAGGGAISSGSSEVLRQLAELCAIPVTTTLMGKGVFPENHPLSLGMLGMHGTKYANYAVNECDLLITIGARFSDRVTVRADAFAPKARIIHIDIDPAEIGKNVQVDIPIVGDVKRVLEQLCQVVQARTETEEWSAKIREWKDKYPLRYHHNGKIKPQFVIEQIYEVTGGNAIIATEVGQNQMWAAQFYTFTKPRTFISSGGLGTMGFGLPAAIGAQIGRPGETVFNIAGDGSIQMNIQELATAADYKLPLKVAILNNNYLGMVRQWQDIFYNGRLAYSDISGPDYVKLAEAYGAVGMQVTRPEDVRRALQKAMQVEDRPVLIDFLVDRKENVFPMIPPEGTISKMLEE